MTLLDRIDQAILKCAEKALQDSKTLQELQDTLKILAPYYTAMKKGQKSGETGDEDGFDNFADAIHGADKEHDDAGSRGSKVSTDRRRVS